MRAPSGRGVGDVLTDIAHNLERLVRAHVHLEAAGVLEAAAAMTRGVGLLAIGVVLALVAALLLLLSAVARLRELMPLWGAFLLVAVSAGLLSAVVAGVGMRTLRRRPVTSRFDPDQLECDPWPIPPPT